MTHVSRGYTLLRCQIQQRNMRDTRLIKLKGYFDLCLYTSGQKNFKGVFRMSQKSKADEEKLEAILKAIQDLQFGEVHITIQDGVIVQINRLEKQRFSQKSK